MTNRLLLAIVLLLPLIGACGITLGAVAPRPTINLGVSNQRLALALAPRITDAFDVPCANGNCTVHVTGFRTSLEAGFAASIERYYAPAGDNADLTLRFESVSIEFPSGSPLILHFSAQLDDREGRTIGRSFGTLRPSREVDLEDTLSQALEMMFEKVAADCFVPLSIAR
jgi:hypothetical protein